MRTDSEVYTEQWWYDRQYRKYLRNTFQPEYLRIIKVLEEAPIPKLLPTIDLAQGSGLYIYGPLGSGKTILAAQIFMDLAKEAYLSKKMNEQVMLFTSVPKVLDYIKRSYDKKKDDNESTIIQKLIEVDVLVLDEFGASKPSDWLLDVLYLIVGGRYDRMKSTIFTSNYDLANVAATLGDERITSRISRTCEIIRKKPWDDPS